MDGELAKKKTLTTPKEEASVSRYAFIKISGKMRHHVISTIVYPDLALETRKTMDFITTVLGPEQDRHIDFLTIHPRTRSTPSSTPINVEALELLTSTFGDKVPILVSGDVFTLNTLPFTSHLVPEEHQRRKPPLPQIQIPKLAGLMSARAILANPALYAGYDACPWSAVETFMNKVAKAPLPFKLVLHHLSEMCAPGMGPNKNALLTKPERAAMLACGNMLGLIDFLDEKRTQVLKQEGESNGNGNGYGNVIPGLRRDVK